MSEQIWLGDVIRSALRANRDVRLDETEYGVCVTIDGEQVPMEHEPDEWALPWEAFEYEVSSDFL